MAYTPLTSRKIPAGTVVVSTYGAAIDARNYGPGVNGGLMGWFTAKASSTNVEKLEVYRETGQTLSMYADYIQNIPAQSGPRIICPAGIPGESSWQGHNGTPLSGVGFTTGSTPNATAGLFIDKTNVRIFDLIVDGPSGKRAVYIMSSDTGEVHIIGNILRRTGTTPTGPAQSGIGMYETVGTSIKIVNNIIVGFYYGCTGTLQTANSVVYNNTFINIVHSGIAYDSNIANGLVFEAYCYNNKFYNCGQASTYYPGRSGSNVTLNAASDLANYAGSDYHLSATASEAIGTGTNLSADTRFAFDDDNDHELRGTTWDVGSDKYTLVTTNLDFTFARNLPGVIDFTFARDLPGYIDFEFARNIGDVLTDLTFTFARDIPGFIDLTFDRDVPGVIDFTFARHIYGTLAGYSNFTPYFKEKIFKHIFGITSYQTPDLYLGLSTTDPLEDGSGITEPVGGNYSRPLVSAWGTPVNGVVSNNAAIRMPKATGDWDTIPYIFWSDAPVGGNVLAVGRLFTPLDVPGTADRGLWTIFQTGSLKIGMGGNMFPGFVNSLLQSLVTGSELISGDISYGLLNVVNQDGTYSEFTATGYNRVIRNNMEFFDSIYINNSSIDFPTCLSGHDWGIATNYIMFISNIPFSYGILNNVVINNAIYGSTGFKIQANTIVIEVL